MANAEDQQQTAKFSPWWDLVACCVVASFLAVILVPLSSTDFGESMYVPFWVFGFTIFTTFGSPTAFHREYPSEARKLPVMLAFVTISLVVGLIDQATVQVFGPFWEPPAWALGSALAVLFLDWIALSVLRLIQPVTNKEYSDSNP